LAFILSSEIKKEQMEKNLERTRERVFAGVCGGIAKYFGWDAGKVRLLYVLISILSAAFPGILVYVILWFVMPEEKLSWKR
tara:strand:- start:164019 stop:164261 length:243 start_codon:yes stop_codon:yes gene_type:complete